MEKCIKCGKPCRFILCDPCYESLPPAEPEQSVSRPPEPSFGIGLPVSVGGVHRF